MLQDRIPTKTFQDRRLTALEDPRAQLGYLHDVEAWSGMAEHLGSATEHSVLHGVQTNLYMNFMERTWHNLSEQGMIGLLHPESHFTDPKGGHLREATYRHLRRHWQFINEAQLFEDVHHQTIYGIQIYGRRQEIEFLNATNLLVPATIDDSFTTDAEAEV